MKEFDPEDGQRLIKVIDAYDAMREFVRLNYGSLLESSDGLAGLYADTDRSVVSGGFPPDESTWDYWVEACNLVTRVDR